MGGNVVLLVILIQSFTCFSTLLFVFQYLLLTSIEYHVLTSKTLISAKFMETIPIRGPCTQIIWAQRSRGGFLLGSAATE